jgi:hypothetical protein
MLNTIDEYLQFFYLVFGISMSLVLYRNFCVYGKKHNKCYYEFNQIKYKKNVIHLHHWIIHSILLFFNYFNPKNFLYYLYAGLNIGGIIDGIIAYDNWYVIFHPW